MEQRTNKSNCFNFFVFNVVCNVLFIFFVRNFKEKIKIKKKMEDPENNRIANELSIDYKIL